MPRRTITTGSAEERHYDLRRPVPPLLGVPRRPGDGDRGGRPVPEVQPGPPRSPEGRVCHGGPAGRPAGVAPKAAHSPPPAGIVAVLASAWPCHHRPSCCWSSGCGSASGSGGRTPNKSLQLTGAARRLSQTWRAERGHSSFQPSLSDRE